MAKEKQFDETKKMSEFEYNHTIKDRRNESGTLKQRHSESDSHKASQAECTLIQYKNHMRSIKRPDTLHFIYVPEQAQCTVHVPAAVQLTTLICIKSVQKKPIAQVI